MLSPPNNIVATTCTKDSQGTFYILPPYFKGTKQPGRMLRFGKLSKSWFTQAVTADPGLEPRPYGSISAPNHILVTLATQSWWFLPPISISLLGSPCVEKSWSRNLVSLLGGRAMEGDR